MTHKTNVGLVQWAKNLMDQPYWFGTCSYKATESLLKRKATQYPSHYAGNRMSRYRQDIRSGATVQDCVGIIKGYYWTKDDGTQKYSLGARPDKGANGMFTAATEKGPIAYMPKIIGLIVHLNGHVGVYIGDGWVIEARGFKYGVVLTRLNDRQWTSWFKCPYIEYIDGMDEEVLFTDSEKLPVSYARKLAYVPGRTMLRGADIEQVQKILANLGFDPGFVDGIYGPKTKGAVEAFQKNVMLPANGIVDRTTWDMLVDIQALEDISRSG